MLTKLSRETLAEQAARNLIAFIESQDLKPGKLLPPESQLATDFGVSRPIIREALKSLEGKGVVEVVSGKGTIVKPLDSQSLRLYFQRAMQIEHEAIIDLLELRKGIEVQSSTLAAVRRTSDDLTRLKELVSEMRHNLHSPDTYVELDIAFHQQVALMTHNAMIYHMVTAIRDALKDTLHEQLLRQQTDEQLERVQAGHETILMYLEQSNPAGAERAMAAHFDDAVTSLVHGTMSKQQDTEGLAHNHDE